MPAGEGAGIGADWLRKAESAGKDSGNLSRAAAAFGLRRLYANPGRAAGRDDPDVFALIGSLAA